MTERLWGICLRKTNFRNVHNSTWLLEKADSTELGPIRDYKPVAYLKICGTLQKPQNLHIFVIQSSKN